MSRKRVLLGLAWMTAVMVVLAACSGAGASSTKNEPTITVTTNPNPAIMGDVELIMQVKDAAGKPLDGAKVSVVASMSGMPMGDPLRGQATGQGNGRYSIKAPMSMSGAWDVTVRVDNPGMESFSKDLKINVK